MSSVETGQMSAVETGQMSAAETGQMSAVETRQMENSETGERPVLPVDICLVKSQQKTSVLSQQQTSVMSQQQTSVLSQQQTSASAFITQHQHSASTISIHPISPVLAKSSLGWASPSQHPNLAS